MIFRLVFTALQVIGITIGQSLYFIYAYSRLQNGLILSVLFSGIVLGVLYWWTWQINCSVWPWGERALGAALAVCGYTLWGQLRKQFGGARRRRRVVSS